MTEKVFSKIIKKLNDIEYEYDIWTVEMNSNKSYRCRELIKVENDRLTIKYRFYNSNISNDFTEHEIELHRKNIRKIDFIQKNINWIFKIK